MQMVAASKMRKAQQPRWPAGPMPRLMNDVLVSLQKRTDHKLHPLLAGARGEEGTRDRHQHRQGLGRRAEHEPLSRSGEVRSGQDDLSSSPDARRGSSSRARKRDIARRFQVEGRAVVSSRPRRSRSSAMEKFLSGEVDKVSVLYTHFVNTLTQKPTVRTLLPIIEFRTVPQAARGSRDTESADPMVGYIFEPTAGGGARRHAAALSALSGLPDVLDARASEHSARMVAMKNATDNAQAIHQGSDARIQQDAPGQHHDRTARNHHRADGARLANTHL